MTRDEVLSAAARAINLKPDDCASLREYASRLVDCAKGWNEYNAFLTAFERENPDGAVSLKDCDWIVRLNCSALVKRFLFEVCEQLCWIAEFREKSDEAKRRFPKDMESGLLEEVVDALTSFCAEATFVFGDQRDAEILTAMEEVKEAATSLGVLPRCVEEWLASRDDELD